MKIFFLASFLILSLWSPWSRAAIEFVNIDDSDLKKIHRDFSGLFSYTTASPPSSLKSIFGLEVGLVAGITSTPGIASLAKEVNSSNRVNSIPHAWFMLGLTTFKGVTFELNYTPELSLYSASKQEHLGLGVKWTLSDSFSLPFASMVIAIKGTFTQSKMFFTQIDPLRSDISFKNSMSGLIAQVGVNFVSFEPYANIGYLSANGKMSSSVPLIFIGPLRGKALVKSTVNSLVVGMGLQFKISLLRLALEYQSAFRTSHLTGKIAIRF